jgi:hypothetical protein
MTTRPGQRQFGRRFDANPSNSEQFMPEKSTLERAKEDKREGKSPSTQAGEFVRAEIDKIRRGEHGARSAKQAIAIGLSEARRAGVDLPPPRKGAVPEKTRTQAIRQSAAAQAGGARRKPSPKRSRATLRALKREGSEAASHTALSRQARAAAKQRTPAQRSASARKAARTRAEES